MQQFDKLKKGDLLAITHYVKAVDVVKANKFNPNDKVSVKDIDTGMDFDVIGAPLINRLASADEVNSTKKITKTAIAEKLTESYNKPISVCFTKVDGSERVMRGRYVSHEVLMGRSQIEDLDLDGDITKRLRQVDHRTIKWLIVDGVKYEVKK